MPGDLSEFELQALFSFSRAELDLITRRRSDSLKLGLALHIGFARMTGRPLNSVRIVPPTLLHLGWRSSPRIWCVCAVRARAHPMFPSLSRFAYGGWLSFPTASEHDANTLSVHRSF